MDEIRITLETLYDILRNEKKRDDLQKLESTFFVDVVSYLREKTELLEQKSREKNIFATGERDKLEYELRSIKRILKEIYEKREKKIMDIALNKSRTGSDIIDTSAMLREEKEFYTKLLQILDVYRRGVYANLIQGQLPDIADPLQEPVRLPVAAPSLAQFETKEEQKETNAMTKIRFIHPLPSFVWKDMKVYGPFDSGEEIEIYSEVADLIVRKGRAVKI